MRQNDVNRAIVSVILAGLILTACGEGGRASTFAESDSAALMAAALTQLVTEDHTFGDGLPPFTEYLIETSTVTNSVVASGDEDDTKDSARPLSDDERFAVESAIAAFGPVRWVTNPDEWRTDDLTPVIDGSVILGVGIPSVDGDGALVPVSLWCGGLCGTWLTYRLELIEGAWQVIGIEGPIAIS